MVKYNLPLCSGGKLSNKDEVTWLRQCETELGMGIRNFVLSLWLSDKIARLSSTDWKHMSRGFVFRKKRLNPSGLFQFGLKGSVAGANFLLPVIQLLIAVSLLFGVAFWIAMTLCYSKTIQTLLCCCLVPNSAFRMGPSQCEMLSMTQCQGLTASAWELGVARGVIWPDACCMQNGWL